MIEKVKNNILTAVIFALLLLIFFVAGCHHHHGGSTPPPVVNNPASYTYTATVVAQHQPGFFSCYNLNGTLFLGTYMNYVDKQDMRAEFARLDGNKVTKLRSIHGSESIYNIAKIDGGSMFLSCEQGPLLGGSVGGGTWVIHPQHLRMGHYWTGWWNGQWVTTEKDAIFSTNKSQVWVGNKLLYQSSEYTWKEGTIIGDTLYLSVYFVHKHTEGGLLTVNLRTGAANLVYSEPGTSCYCLGQHQGKVRYALQIGVSSKIFLYPHTFLQTIPDIAWRMRSIGDTLFLTAAEHGWRKGGPSYLYVLNSETGLFVKKLQIPDGEPWDICAGPAGNQYYLVTRNEKEGNLGRVYLITRSK